MAFLSDKRGAVSVDWVVLTAGVFVMGVAAVYYLHSGGEGSVEQLVSTFQGEMQSAADDLKGGADRPLRIRLEK